ncbi:MAG: hypothetical protein ACOYBL_06250 [Lachnospiraceae bacterium]|jgi:transcriptional regulator with XRE-family HTH domain
MRLNKKELLNIMESQNLKKPEICTRTGLCRRSLEWILDNGQASEEALERIADAVGVNVKNILLPDGFSADENVIEFLRDQGRATVTFSQGRYKTRIKKLAESHPDECEIVAENKDGSLYAHIPVSWIRINPGKNWSEEQRERQAEHARNVFHASNNKRETG